MSDINQLFSGVQLIHKNNHTYTTREGYANPDDVAELPELEWNGEGSSYYNLNPGLYKININGTTYAIMIHDTLSGSNRLVIDNLNHAYIILGLHTHMVYLYELHDYQIIESLGCVLPDTVNDYLDLFVVDGVTRCKAGNSVSMRHPGLLEFISMMNIAISTEQFKDEYLFNMKNYLKSIDLDENNRVCDTMYLEAARNRALFVFRTARLILTGHEKYTKVEEYSTNKVNVFKYDNTLCKASGLIRCSHLPTIAWEEMIDTSYIDEGICISPEGVDRAIYFKVPVAEFATLDDFINEVKYWYMTDTEKARAREYDRVKARQDNLDAEAEPIIYKTIYACPVSICYELEHTTYKQLTLDDYKINTYFNKTWIVVNPYKSIDDNFALEALDNIIGLVPRDNVIKTVAEQLMESGNLDKYEDILRENIKYSHLLVKNSVNASATFPIDNTTVAVVPNNGVIKSMAEQLEESGYPSAYARILAENIILRNLVVTGEINIRTMFFYKHLRIS